jgi:hypothetical protein
MRHVALGASAGATVFAIVVPIIHMLAALAAVVGIVLGPWDKPIEVFIFAMTAAMAGTFPGGLWILLTDARKVNMFNQGREVAEYLLAAIILFLTLTLLVCTRLQSLYEQFRWFISPALLVCGAALFYWRWKRLWRLPTKIKARVALDYALALEDES